MSSASPAARGSAVPMVAALLLLAGMIGLFLQLRRTLEEPGVVGVPETIGYSREGRPLVCYFFGKGQRTLFIMASIHGSEGAGTPLMERLMEWLKGHPETFRTCRIMIMPVANPDGLLRNQRFNLRGVDLNRNFPAGNREDRARFGYAALSEPESRAMHDLILRTLPNVMIAIHQPLNCVDYDGPDPAADLAARLALGTGLQVDKLGTRPGSLGAWFGETLNRPILTLELPRSQTADADKFWADYGPGLVDFVQFFGAGARILNPPPGIRY
jgi:protein MpaA